MESSSMSQKYKQSRMNFSGNSMHTDSISWKDTFQIMPSFPYYKKNNQRHLPILLKLKSKLDEKNRDDFYSRPQNSCSFSQLW